VSIFAEEHADHASKVLPTFPARSNAPGISHVVTNARPVAPRYVLPASILARNVVCIAIAFFFVEHLLKKEARHSKSFLHRL
jgi:hypothetical protein